ncbi:MAG: Coenzyme F420 hydrogenase/dehydrogenase, beta subunit C-terminal domain [Prevotella sp.]|nr:Coenzyme F420 hydrogenase/dehydrogenase, beta subunit C-terminal domain [Prevotella sp.]
MVIIQSDKYKVDLTRCQQCGSCVSVCNKKAIECNTNSYTGLLDITINQERCVKCGLCFDICPANRDTQVGDINELINSKSFYLGHSKDEAVRKQASSGGVVKTLIVEGLKSGFFDGVYTLRKTNTYPFAEGHLFSQSDMPDYANIPNSIYHAVSLNLNMKQIQYCKRLLIVGTACQLKALSLYAKNKCEELYSICIFCKQQKNFNSTRFIAKLAGETLSSLADLKEVEYRGEGWPGRCKFNDKRMPWEKAATLSFGKKLWCVPGCHICGNPYGENTDITVMDPWWLNVDKTTGESLFSINSDKGHILLQSLSPYIDYSAEKVSDVIPALSIKSLKEKNNLIPYFRGDAVSEELRKKGEKTVRKRLFLERYLTLLPKMPVVFYKVINRLF